MGKIYLGLYECVGHVVPYLVIVKVGKPAERSRPGNRGKWDSQMLMMHFLNKPECAARSTGREETIGRGDNAVDGRTAEGTATVTVPGEGAADEMTGSMSLAATVSSLGNDSRGLRAYCTCITDPQNPNATRQAASNAAADPTTPNAKSAEPREPAGTPHKPQNVPHKSGGSSMRGKTQEANEEDPQSMSLEGERGHELSDEAGPNPRPSRR
ncbi:hypothetical protein BU15DRAFT_63904 [Melanogaster broomeanus]|nr:hypothetical protein BU15DRAFT_63904 [Melanogaster broomeanus]